MFDSTLDMSHTDQMSQVIQSVHIEDTEVSVVESFIDFIQLPGKSTDVITKQICDKLQADGLKLEHCYGQGYNNATTMAGHISGVQKCIWIWISKQCLTHVMITHSILLVCMQLVLGHSLWLSLALWKRCTHSSQAPPIDRIFLKNMYQFT